MDRGVGDYLTRYSQRYSKSIFPNGQRDFPLFQQVIRTLRQIDAHAWFKMGNQVLKCRENLVVGPAGREYGDFSVFAHSNALRPHTLVIGQGHVDHATVRRRHWLQSYAAASLGNS